MGCCGDSVCPPAWGLGEELVGNSGKLICKSEVWSVRGGGGAALPTGGSGLRSKTGGGGAWLSNTGEIDAVGQ